MYMIPTETGGGAYLAESVNLDGVSLSIRLLWNDRDGHWFADFESVNGKNCGVRLVPGSLLLSSANRAIPNGDLAVLRVVSDGADALGFDNLGTEWALFYVDSGDAETLAEYGAL